MYCKYCGKEIDEDAQFCQFCGKDLENTIIEKTANSEEVEQIRVNNELDNQKTIEVNEVEINESLFERMPVWKLVILYILSFGWYSIIWFYNQWKIIDKKEEKAKLITIVKSIFAIFTCFWLFRKIDTFYNQYENNDEETAGAFEKNINSILFCIGCFLFNVFGNMYNDFEGQYFAQPIYLILSLVAFTLSIFIVADIQFKINKLNKKHNLKSEYNKWSWKTTVFTILALSYMIYTFLPVIKTLFQY